MAALPQNETTEVKNSDDDTEEDGACYPDDRHLYLTSYYGDSLTIQAATKNADMKYFLSCYIKQDRATTCALVTLNIILNAKQLSIHYDENKNDDNDDDNYEINVDDLRKHSKDSFRYIDEDEMIQIYPKYCDFKSIDKLLESGLSLGQFYKMMIAFDFKDINMNYCDSAKQEMIDEFREQCMKLSINHIIVCNYSLHRITNGIGNGGGHFSTIIAYHKQTDRVLLLDVWTQKSWVKLSELYAAMNTVTGNGSYRGYIVATNIPIDIIQIKKKSKGKFKFWGNKNDKPKKGGKSKTKSKSKQNKHDRKNKRKNKFGVF